MKIVKPLIVKPILVYYIHERREKVSWRQWGGIQTMEDVREEEKRIKRELEELKEKADFKLDILPLSSVQYPEELEGVEGDIEKADVLLIYPASGALAHVAGTYVPLGKILLDMLVSYGKYVVFFLRHRSGPLYLWYEIIHPRFLRRETDVYLQPVGVEDVVVDSYDEVLWRLRALFGLKNTIGRRIVAIGGAAGWDVGGPGRVYGPYLAKRLWRLDIVTVSYEELGRRIKEARERSDYLREAERLAKEYLSEEGVELETDRKFVVNSFLLYLLFKDLLEEHEADALTVYNCMTTIIPMAETTACLALSLLNDEGYIAFCESDFVAIPAGILLHAISGKPVFLNDPTFPHDGIVTVAHCTCPRMMDGKNREPVVITTHFESDYGAAPRVLFRKGQKVTVIDPNFSGKVWVGFKGTIVDTPFLPICRSQAEVRIEGNWRLLLEEMRGFHWILAYGDYLKEVGYALKKVGIKWLNVSES